MGVGGFAGAGGAEDELGVGHCVEIWCLYLCLCGWEGEEMVGGKGRGKISADFAFAETPPSTFHFSHKHSEQY